MLSDEMLHRLDALRLAMQSFVRGGAGGVRKSKALGDSAEFSDFREYAPGDDLRRLDWNAYARFDRLFLKLFMEEQEMHVTIILDASASMGYGEPSKWAFAVDTALMLSYLAVSGGDRVSLAVLNGEKLRKSPLYAGRQGYMQASSFLKDIKPSGAMSLTHDVTRIPLSSGRGMCVLISDLFSGDGSEGALASLLYRKQQAVLVQVLSREEMEPELNGSLHLIDSEGGPSMDVTVNGELLRRYQKNLASFIGGTKAYCHRHGIGYVLMRSDMDLMHDALGHFMRGGIIA
jgi:uncharacterized protein (DUF58 family)